MEQTDATTARQQCSDKCNYQFRILYLVLTFNFAFSIYVQLWLMFTLLLLLFIVNKHYMLWSNWPTSGVKVVILGNCFVAGS
jgi:hypothetical protein